jgi:multisubunit Na+/H+ antiporter MnhB subunit
MIWRGLVAGLMLFAVVVICVSYAWQAVDAWRRRDRVDAFLAGLCLVLFLLIAGIAFVAVFGGD